MPKFFVKSEQIKENKIVQILGEDVKHIAKVLRCGLGDNLTVCNRDTGENYACQIQEIHDTEIQCSILEKIDSHSEPSVYIHLLQGLPKADKMEWIIEKGTEIGITEFTPVRMRYSVAKLEGKDALKKVERWNKIAEVAAKQSGRDKIPTINPVINFAKVYEILQKCDIVLVAYEKELKNTLKHELEQLKKPNINIGVIVGPEGGIAEEEIEQLKKEGARIITLGPRILRTETAPIVIASNIVYALDTK